MKIRLVTALVFLSLSPGAFATESFTGGMTLAFRNAIWQGENHQNAVNVVFEFSCEDGVWAPLYGLGLQYTNGHHRGVVDKAVVTENGFEFEVDCVIHGDGWIPGQHQATWLITLTRNGDGRVSGTWEGRFKNRHQSGVVEGTLWNHPPRDPGVLPPKRGEHPRMLFRQHDIAALREKLARPFGQAYKRMVDRPESRDYLNLAVLYAITGEQQYADRVQDILEAGELENMDRRGFGTGGFGHTQIAQAVTYDLCWNGWDEEFRAKMRRKMVHLVSGQQGLLQIEHPNHHPCSNYYGPGYGTPAITALAYAGDTQLGPPPKKGDQKLKTLLGSKFSSKPIQPDMSLTPPKRRSLKQLIKKIDELDQAAADRIWPGASLALYQDFLKGRMHMYYHYRYGMGTGGFQAETGSYADIASRHPTIYATLYRNMMGQDVSPYPDVNSLMVRRLLQSTLDNSRNRSSTVKLSSATGFSTEWVARNFPIIPKDYQPAVLTAWNHLGNVTGPDTAHTLLGTGGKKGLQGIDLALTFVNYPLDMEPRPLNELPLRWDTEFGHHSFRSGWSATPDDHILQVYAKSKKVRGWNHPNAGTFRLFALGQNWVGGSDNRIGFRIHEPCVLFPENRNINQGSIFPIGKGSQPTGSGSGYGQVEFLESDEDGSARITVNLNEVYASSKVSITRKGRKTLSIQDNNLLPMPENLEDSGITGKRAWGIDYRGVSGAPVTLILVDEIHGGDRRIWQWPLPSGKKNQSSGSPQLRSDGFRISKGGVSMNCTFVTPLTKQPRLDLGPVKVGRIGNSHRSFEGSIPRVVAEGNGHFIAIITISEGDHPDITTQGDGLDTVIQVGDATYRYDGNAVRW